VISLNFHVYNIYIRGVLFLLYSNNQIYEETKIDSTEYGIYTTIVAGILISILGGSKNQIGGPTGVLIPILFAIVIEYGYENLLIAGFMRVICSCSWVCLRWGF
jgi:hypothetical protein